MVEVAINDGIGHRRRHCNEMANWKDDPIPQVTHLDAEISDIYTIRLLVAE
jgi:hypothetical protein